MSCRTCSCAFLNHWKKKSFTCWQLAALFSKGAHVCFCCFDGIISGIFFLLGKADYLRPPLSVEGIKLRLMFTFFFSGWGYKGRSGPFPWRNGFCQRRVVWCGIGWAFRKEWRGSGWHKVQNALDLYIKESCCTSSSETIESSLMIVFNFLFADIFSVSPNMAYLLQCIKSHALASRPPRQPKRKRQFVK